MTLIERRSTTRGRGVDKGKNAHPIGMPALVSIEMWERFSFYGMQAILVYYLYADDGLGMSTQHATATIGAYGAFVYLAAIAGGWLADNILGAERTLFLGAIGVMIGHLTLSFVPGATGAIAGLSVIGLGSGFIKTCAVSALGVLYSGSKELERLRQLGFQLFYLGIQIGALFGPILTGYLAKRYNWHTGFGAAAILMAAGLASYTALRPRMLRELRVDQHNALCRPQHPASRRSLAVIVTLTMIAITAGGIAALKGMPIQRLGDGLLIVVLLSIIALFSRLLLARDLTRSEKRKVREFIPLFAACAIFWSVAYQNFGVFAVYSDVRLDRSLGGWEIPAAWIQTLNPILVMALAGPVAWAKLKAGPKAERLSTQMSLGVALSGIAFLIFLPFVAAPARSTPLLAMVLIAFTLAIGELCIGPVGMAATSQFAPTTRRATFSALYFLTFAVGMAVSGKLSTWYNPHDPGAERLYFAITGGVTITVAIGLLALSRRQAAA